MKIFIKMFPMIFQSWMGLGTSRRDITNGPTQGKVCLDPWSKWFIFTQIGPHLEYQRWNLNACDRRKQTNGIKPWPLNPKDQITKENGMHVKPRDEDKTSFPTLLQITIIFPLWFHQSHNITTKWSVFKCFRNKNNFEKKE
jgi:hypothetical protein